MNFSVKIELPSDPQLLCVVRAAVHQCCQLGEFSDEDCRAMTLAVDEAMTNVIRHAYGNRHDQRIELLCASNAAGMEFLLLNDGAPVDESKLQQGQLGELRAGGLGTHLMSRIMDRVEYSRPGNRNQVKLVKFRSAVRTEGDK